MPRARRVRPTATPTVEAAPGAEPPLTAPSSQKERALWLNEHLLLRQLLYRFNNEHRGAGRGWALRQQLSLGYFVPTLTTLIAVIARFDALARLIELDVRSTVLERSAGAAISSWRIPGELRRFVPSGIKAGRAASRSGGAGSDTRDDKSHTGSSVTLGPSAITMEPAAGIKHPSPHVQVRPEPAIPPAVVVSAAASIRGLGEEEGPAERARPKKRRRHRGDEIDDLFADF